MSPKARKNMSHKVHPKILRIKETKDWLSRGFYQKRFPRYLEEDFKIRKYLKKQLSQASVEDIEIERSQSALKVIIKTSRPALVIGRGGEAVEKMKRKLISIVSAGKESEKEEALQDVKIEVLEVKNPWASAGLTAQWMAGQIQKMMPYRRVLKMALSRLMEQKEVEGAKVQVAGRLNGIEISRTEWLQQGRLPRQNLRAQIDYGFEEAHCTYGAIGVKVWVYKGEKFD